MEADVFFALLLISTFALLGIVRAFALSGGGGWFITQVPASSRQLAVSGDWNASSPCISTHTSNWAGLRNPATAQRGELINDRT
jgi:hypothetical protein